MIERIDYSAVNSLPELLSLLRKKEIPENKYWEYVAAYQESKARERGIPLNGLFEITPLCNLDCRMCYVHLNKEQLNGAKLLTVGQWKDIIQQAHYMGMLNATLTGGECLTYPGFVELYMFLRSLGIKTSIKTNGLLFDEERIAFFNRFPPRSVTVSLYGSSDDAYWKVTGHAVFDVVYRNIMLLKNADFPVSIAITPSRFMLDDMEQVLELGKQIGIPFSFNIALFPPREETGRELCDLSSQEYVSIYHMLKNTDAVPLEEAELPECGSSIGKPEYGIRCGAGMSSFNVSWNGLLTGCDNLNSLRVSLLDHSFADAWKQINEDARAYPLPVECSNCAYDKICFSCAAFRGNGAEKGHCNPNVCERARLFVKEGIYNL